MRRFNFTQALRPALLYAALSTAAAAAGPATGPAAAAARSVQDGVLFDGVPLSDSAAAPDLVHYQGASDARFLDWLSDGGMLVARRQGGQDQLLRLAAADEAGAAAAGPEPSRWVGPAAAQTYRSETLAFLQDAPDGSGMALFLAPVGGGAARQLVGAEAHPGAPVWAHDDHRLAFSASLRDPRQPDLYVLDTADAADAAAPRLIATGGATGGTAGAAGGAAGAVGGAWQVLAWTSADRALLVRQRVSGAGDALWLVDVATGAQRRVDAPATDAPPSGRIAAARLAGDGRSLYLLTDRGSAYLQLRAIDLYDASVHGLTPALDHDVEQFDVSADGRYFAYAYTDDGYARIIVVDRKAALQYTLADLPSGVVTQLQFDRTGARLAIGLAPAVAPTAVYVYTLATQTAARWTRGDLGSLNAAQLVAPQTLRFPTWDRVNGRLRLLTALLHRAGRTGSHAVLVVLDDADLRARLDLFTQYCVEELGLTVLTPRLRRGESGALDFGALLTWIGTQPDLQRDQVLVLGRGSGGTLGLTVLGLYGDRVRAAIDIDGGATLAELAPIRGPVLLIRGLESPALDAASAEQLLWRLRNANVESWLVAPREVQGTLDGATTRSAAQQVMARFLASRSGSGRPSGD